MIPFFQIPPFQWGGLSIHLFEILTSLGIFLGIQIALRSGHRKQLNQNILIDTLLVSIAVGFFGAHVMHVWFYQKDWTHPLELLQVWKGISSTGGFVAGGIGCWFILRWQKSPVLLYGDSVLEGLLVSIFLGRLGCTAAHDHLGKLTSFFLGIQYPDGTRHNLGMEEAIFLSLFLAMVHVKKIRDWLDERPGRRSALTLVCYGVARFFLDFLRANDLPFSDPRYAGLTPAQYACIGFVTIGFCIIYKHKLLK